MLYAPRLALGGACHAGLRPVVNQIWSCFGVSKQAKGCCYSFFVYNVSNATQSLNRSIRIEDIKQARLRQIKRNVRVRARATRSAFDGVTFASCCIECCWPASNRSPTLRHRRGGDNAGAASITSGSSGSNDRGCHEHDRLALRRAVAIAAAASAAAAAAAPLAPPPTIRLCRRTRARRTRR